MKINWSGRSHTYSNKDINYLSKINFRSKHGMQINYREVKLEPEEYTIEILQD